MSTSLAFIPSILEKNQPQQKLATNVLIVLGGTLLLAALAQVKIPLPFTPVPITGQTFGVALVALSLGRKHAFATLLAYLGLGAAGLPIFAGATSGLSFGPTLGYLVGMAVAGYWMGFLADLGWTKTFMKTWIAAISGSMITFAFGCLVLSQFVGWQNVFALGVLPFLPGDLIKGLSAAGISSSLRKRV